MTRRTVIGVSEMLWRRGGVCELQEAFWGLVRSCGGRERVFESPESALAEKQGSGIP